MPDLVVPGYTVAALVSVLTVLALERLWWRTGVLRTPQYWCAVAVLGVAGVLVDGFLTDLAAPSVVLDPAAVTGLRWPWDVPVEDVALGWSLVTLTILVWVRLGDQGPGSSCTCRCGGGRRRRDAPYHVLR